MTDNRLFAGKQQDHLKKIIKQLGFDDFKDELFDSKADTLFNNENDQLNLFTSTAIDSPLKDSFFIVIYDSNENYCLDKIIEELNLTLSSDNFFDEIDNLKVRVIEIFGSSNIKKKINRSKDDTSKIRKEIQKFIRSKPGNSSFSLTNIEYLDYIIPDLNKFDSSNLTININDRVRSIKNVEKVEGIYLTSYVFTAQVIDIINLYDKMGDLLFSDNVRIGNVKDNIGVGQAIQDTYKKLYDCFAI